MKNLPLVRDIMTTDLITLPPEMEINRAMTILLDARISGAPVVDTKGDLVGVLSKKDCLKAALNASFFQEWGGAVSDYMSAKVEVLDPDMDLVKAAETFLGSQYRRFPVVKDGRLVGQVSRCDILRGLREHWS